MTTLFTLNSSSSSPLAVRFLLLPLAWACFALSPTPNAFGVTPAPDGGYPNGNTAEGTDALFSLTTGIDNTALGFKALYYNTTSGFNTATGYEALFSNTTIGTTGGSENTADGYKALFRNSTGYQNTAIGSKALVVNTTGHHNTATGASVLVSNTTGFYNTASGFSALSSNTTGSDNTASGFDTLASNTTGSYNTATGEDALASNTTGYQNTATGRTALARNTTGNSNIALGFNAGQSLTTGDSNIDIGNDGVAGEANTIRIGDEGTQTATYIAGIYGTPILNNVPVVVDANGQLGVAPAFSSSSPSAMTPRRAHQLETMVAALKAKVAKDEAAIAQQQKQIKALTSGLEKVSAELELSKPAPRTVNNNQ